jgi:hypothetical protein
LEGRRAWVSHGAEAVSGRHPRRRCLHLEGCRVISPAVSKMRCEQVACWARQAGKVVRRRWWGSNTSLPLAEAAEECLVA